MRNRQANQRETGVHLRITLVDDTTDTPSSRATQAARTPYAHISSSTAKSLQWDDLAWPNLHSVALRLLLPEGSKRPPLLRIGLYDDELSDVEQPLATGEVLLGKRSATEGTRTVFLRAGRALRDVAVEFAFELKDVTAAQSLP